MFSNSSTSSAITAFITTTAYDELVEKIVLELARKLLEDDQVNENLLDERAQVGRAVERSLCTAGETLAAMLKNAAPSGLRWSRMGRKGVVKVAPDRAGAFLRELLTLAARESARLKFSGTEAEPTTREISTGKLEQMKLAGDPDAGRYERSLKYDDAEVLDGASGIFDHTILPDLGSVMGFAPTDDDRRLETRKRADDARASLVAALGDCAAVKGRWAREEAALDNRIHRMIAERFGAEANDSDDLTVAIFEAVQRALSDVGETKKAVARAYTDKIMEFAGLVALRDGDRTAGDRVRKAQYRVRKRETLLRGKTTGPDKGAKRDTSTPPASPRKRRSK